MWPTWVGLRKTERMTSHDQSDTERPTQTQLRLAVLKTVRDVVVGSVAQAVSGQLAREAMIAAAIHTLIEGRRADLLASDPQTEPAVRQAIDHTWRAVADIILRAVTPPTKAIDQDKLDVLGTLLAGALGSTPRLWSDSESEFDRSSVKTLITDMVWSGIRGALDGVEQAALNELDEGDAQARDGHRHLIQQVVHSEPQVTHPVPVAIYLESRTNAVEVEAAVRDVLHTNEIAVMAAKEPIIGSWFRLMLGRTKKALTSAQMADVMTRLERAIELQTLHKPQAEINSAELDGVAKLITALGQEQNACIQIGSVFLLKVDGSIVSRNVSQREMAFLERNSGLLGTPREVLAALDKAASRTSAADQVRIQDGALQLTVQRPDDRGCVGLTVAVGDSTAVYEVGFDASNGPVPVSSGGMIHIQAHHGKAVIRAHDVTITVCRLSDPTKRFELVVASGNGRTTSYELDFTQPRGA
jgi:hypothetical protein